MEGSARESRKRRNSYQDATLVSFMRKYPKLANSTYRNRTIIKQLWDALTKLLNSRGPKRDVIQWRKVWTDWKNYVRKKMLENKLPLSLSEKAIWEICSTSPENKNTNYNVDELEKKPTFGESNKPGVRKPRNSKYSRSRSRSRTRSTSRTSSRTSSSYSRSLSRSSSSTFCNTSSMRSCSSALSSSTARSDKSTQGLSPAQSQFYENVDNTPSLISKIDVFDSSVMSLPEGEAQSACEKSKYNVKGQFKKQSIALNALVEMLNKNISTQKETLETAKRMSNAIREFNTNINVYTDNIREKFTGREIHNRQMELIYMKKNLLQMELVSIQERCDVLRDMREQLE